MPDCYLTSYVPLAANPVGRRAVQQQALPPLIDGAIRRDPDFEHEHPGISSLGRSDKFATRLKTGDRVAYMTKKSSFGMTRAPHHRLPVVLEVVESLQTHEAAAQWYHEQSMELPSNCMVEGNRAKPLEQTHRIWSSSEMATDSGTDEQRAKAWDQENVERAQKSPVFVICRPLYCELTWKAPRFALEEMQQAFGKAPSTQNPGKLDGAEFDHFLHLLGLEVVS